MWNLINKLNRERLIHSEQAHSSGGGEGKWGSSKGLNKKENKGERTHGHGQRCGDCRSGTIEVEEGIEGIHDDGKNKIKKT